MKKLITCVLSAALAMGLVACGGSSSSAPKEYNLETVVNTIAEANAVANSRSIDDFSIENDFMLNSEDIVSYYGIASNDQGNSATILAVQCATGKASDVKSALETYKQNQVAYYGNYAEFADGQACIEDGRVVDKGDYVVLVFANTEGASYTDIDKAVSAALD